MTNYRKITLNKPGSAAFELARIGFSMKLSGEVRSAFGISCNSDMMEGKGHSFYVHFCTEEKEAKDKQEEYIQKGYFTSIEVLPVLFLTDPESTEPRFAMPLSNGATEYVVDLKPKKSLREQALAKLSEEEKRALGLLK